MLVRARRGIAALGPAFVAAVAYVDPGNIATNTAAGATHGYGLLWVVVLATLMAGPVQYLSGKLGLVSGHSLPQYVARHTPKHARIAYWAQAELVAIATDLAEIIGAAVALNLLLGVPLVAGGLAAGFLSMVVLALRDRYGARVFELFCAFSLLGIGAGFMYGILRQPPQFGELVGGLRPMLDGQGALLLAAGIVGATVMPHAIYLHSSLTTEQGRRLRILPLIATSAAPAVAARVQRPGLGRSDTTLLDRALEPDADSAAHADAPRSPANVARLDRALRVTRLDVALAMLLAGSVNVSMLVLGAAVLRGSEDSLAASANALSARVGAGAGIAFLVALLISGLSSTAVGTQAGEHIMRGLLERRVPVVLRRVVTLTPALVLLASGANPLSVLVLSQVALSLGLPFALVPLVRATSSRRWMHERANVVPLRVVAWLITALVVSLDLVLVGLTLTGR